ncbi:hypothetical protein CY34DRAFT_558415 [Suillus luteus UH-Slu-Lm8-n1]|uniref:DUF6533 domain-containing protein n=1 Tax=Suillus luteus UH-Slu-Lm8-n1 TaxID=930992 RepID=A0A0D0A1Y5_9AGAM|nr:hypothetical protein CY34DRAFT_558415 [Suillus luteus UH-Slu-Lm8-n1]
MHSCLRSHRNTHFKQSRVLRRGQISISIMPFGDKALDGGIFSTDTATKSLTFPTSLAHTHLSNMTFVSNDPSWWPYIDSDVFYSYWIVAAGVVVVYDWGLTVGQEIELIWVSDGASS